MSDVSPADVRLVLPAVPESAGIARHVVSGLLPRDLDARRREQVLVAISEAVTNAVLHGHRDGVAPSLELQGRRGPDQLELRVVDHGRGMLPKLDGRGLGIGLSLVAAAADAMEVRGAELRITFALRS